MITAKEAASLSIFSNKVSNRIENAIRVRCYNGFNNLTFKFRKDEASDVDEIIETLINLGFKVTKNKSQPLITYVVQEIQINW